MYFNTYYVKFNQKKENIPAAYIKSAMGTLRYISREGTEPVWGDEIYSMEEAEEIIRRRAEMNPHRFWRAIWSANLTDENPNKDLDLWELARKTIEYIKAKDPDMEFILAQHNDTNNPHVQGLMFFKARLEPDEIKWKIRELARGYALEQQEQKKEVKQFLSRLHTITQFRDVTKELPVEGVYDEKHSTGRLVGMAGGRANNVADANKKVSHRRIRKVREQALACPSGRDHKVTKWNGKNWCRDCQKVLEQSMELGL